MGSTRVALTAAAAALVLTSTGEVVVLAVLLAMLARGPAPAAAAGLALVAGAARWGTTELGAIAGAQAVLGPTLAVEPVPAAVGAGCAALALVLAAPRSREPGGDGSPVATFALAVPFGGAAAALAAGPALGGPLLLRAGATVAAVGIAAAAAHAPAPRIRAALAVAAALAAVGLTVGTRL